MYTIRNQVSRRKKSDIVFCNKIGVFSKIVIWFVLVQCNSQLP